MFSVLTDLIRLTGEIAYEKLGIISNHFFSLLCGSHLHGYSIMGVSDHFRTVAAGSGDIPYR